MRTRPGETLDGALGGALKLFQREDGYRFSLDPLLLADFVSPVDGSVVELGTGCGVMALAIAHRSPRARVTAIELQPQLAELAHRNAELNALAERVLVREADFRKLHGLVPERAFDLVVSNPPFQPAGRTSPTDEKARARHELTCTVEDVVAAANTLLCERGRLAVIYPAERLTAVLGALGKLAPTRLRFVHPRVDAPAKLFMLEAARGKSRLEILAPLVLHQDGKRDYTSEAARILGEPERS